MIHSWFTNKACIVSLLSFFLISVFVATREYVCSLTFKIKWDILFVQKLNIKQLFSDSTALIASGVGAIVRQCHKQGKGNDVKKMLERDCDMVVGDRLFSTYFEENKRPFHNFGNSLVKKSITLLKKRYQRHYDGLLRI